MIKIISRKKYNNLTSLINKYGEDNKKLRDLLEKIHTEYIGLSADKAVEESIKLLISFGVPPMHDVPDNCKYLIN